jgi:hypothetical protein
MKGSRIRLSRIVAFNWYGFRTIIEVDGLTLLCGETGTGKSALLDLIQFVMSAGSVKFNKAAAGESNARDVRSYCLCDSRTRHGDGRKRYLRRSGVTIAALEFTWPAAPGAEPRRETWGIRVEFESPSAQPSYVRFFVPGRIERADFCDEKGDLLAEEVFRSNVKHELDGDAGFATNRAFQEEMGVARHLHFDDVQMRKTLPKAIAFEFDSDYQKFIREFILEASLPDVTNTRRSLEALRSAELRVSKLHEQQRWLERIAAEDAAYQEALREEAIFGHLRHALDYAECEEKSARVHAALVELCRQHNDDKTNLENATAAREVARSQLADVRLLAGKEDPQLSELERLTRLEKEQDAEIERLSGIARSTREFLIGRADSWERWLRHAAAMEWEVGVSGEGIAALRGIDVEAALAAVAGLCERFSIVWSESQDRLAPVIKEIGSLEERQTRLEGRLAQLRDRRTAPTPLFDTLAATDVAADTLARVVEVSPAGEPWWGVIEALLAHERSALLVGSEADFERAREHWAQMQTSESLINPEEIPDAAPVEGALSSLIQTKHPVARRFLDWRLGGIVAVSDAAELEAHSAAATPEGAVKEAPLRRWLVPEKDLTLGEEGLRRLVAAKEAEHREVSERLGALRRKRDDVHTWLQSGKTERLDRNDTVIDSREALRLPSLRTARGTTKSTIELLQTPELEARLAQVRDLETTLESANQTIGRLTTPVTDFQVKEKKLLDDIESVGEELTAEGIKLEGSRVKLPPGILDMEIAERLGKAVAGSSPWRVRRDMADEARRVWRDNAGKARERRADERHALWAAHQDEYGDFDRLDDSNARYDQRLREIREHEVKRFETLATERRADWEVRLQEDVLNGLSEKLREAKQTIADFRRILSREIGGYRYMLSQHRDSNQSAMWKLIDQSGEGLHTGDALMDWSLQGEIEQAKRELMHALDNPDDQRAAALLDYRTYHRYDLDMIPVGFDDDTEGKISLQESGRSGSGGEGQAPFFVAVLAAFHRVYDRGQRGDAAHLGLVVMDEAFSKLSAGHIADCLSLAEGFGLQLVLAFPMDRLGTMVQHADSIIQCRLEKRLDAKGVPVEIVNDVIYWERDAAAPFAT